jgi:hypothetical protein
MTQEAIHALMIRAARRVPRRRRGGDPCVRPGGGEALALQLAGTHDVAPA